MGNFVSQTKVRQLIFTLIAACGISFSYFGFELFYQFSMTAVVKAVFLFLVSAPIIYFIFSRNEVKFKSSLINKVMEFKPLNYFCLTFVMFLLYSVIITIFSQINLSPDGVAQLLWFNNYGCFDPSSRQDLPGYWLSDHHPFLDTLIYGAFWKMGESLFGSGLLGDRVFVYIQALAWSFVIVLACFWIQKRAGGGSKNTSFFVYVFMLLNPLIPLWISCVLKDITAMPFIMLWLMLLIDVVFPVDKVNRRKLSVILLIVLFTLSVLMRRSTVVSCVFIICGLVCVSIYRLLRHRRELFVGSAVGVIATAAGLLISIVFVPAIAYPTLNVAPAGPQESLSIPVQQTIGIVKNHKNEISEEDLQKIEAVVPVDTCLELYTNQSADPVKDQWKRDSATDEDKRNFLNVWIKLTLKYPVDAVKSCRYIFAYWFYTTPIVDFPTTWAGWDDKGALDLFSPVPQGYQTQGQIFACDTLNKIFEKAILSPLRIPFSLITYTVWLPLICFCFALSRKNYIGFTSLFIPYSFALTLITVAASQVRYAAPLMFFMPIIIGCIAENKKDHSREPSADLL